MTSRTPLATNRPNIRIHYIQVLNPRKTLTRLLLLLLLLHCARICPSKARTKRVRCSLLLSQARTELVRERRPRKVNHILARTLSRESQ